MLPYYFLVSKTMLHRCFCTGFSPVSRKNRKKSANFLQFFLVVYQQVRRNLKKKLVKSLDKILKCRIFAACLELNNNKSKNNNKNQKEK